MIVLRYKNIDVWKDWGKGLSQGKVWWRWLRNLKRLGCRSVCCQEEGGNRFQVKPRKKLRLPLLIEGPVPDILEREFALCKRFVYSLSMVWNILRSILKWYRYKIHIMQMLHLQDLHHRFDFACGLAARIGVFNLWPWNIMWLNETHFTLNGAVIA